MHGASAPSLPRAWDEARRARMVANDPGVPIGLRNCPPRSKGHVDRGARLGVSEAEVRLRAEAAYDAAPRSASASGLRRPPRLRWSSPAPVPSMAICAIICAAECYAKPTRAR